jgi:hypothetical protein
MINHKENRHIIIRYLVQEFPLNKMTYEEKKEDEEEENSEFDSDKGVWRYCYP